MKKILVFVMAMSLLFGGTLIAKEAAKTAAKPVVKAETTLVDINSASKEELMKLSGIGDVLAGKIIAGRPYVKKDELLKKKILPKATYDKVKDSIIAKKAAK